MNVFTKLSLYDKTLLYNLFGTTIILVGETLFIAFFYSKLPPFIPLYNQLPWGDARLATKLYIFVPLAIGFSVFAFNIICSFLMYAKMPLTTRILSIASLLVALLSAMFVVRTIRLII